MSSWGKIKLPYDTRSSSVVRSSLYRLEASVHFWVKPDRIWSNVRLLCNRVYFPMRLNMDICDYHHGSTYYSSVLLSLSNFSLSTILQSVNRVWARLLIRYVDG